MSWELDAASGYSAQPERRRAFAAATERCWWKGSYWFGAGVIAAGLGAAAFAGQGVAAATPADGSSTSQSSDSSGPTRPAGSSTSAAKLRAISSTGYQKAAASKVLRTNAISGLSTTKPTAAGAAAIARPGKSVNTGSLASSVTTTTTAAVEDTVKQQNATAPAGTASPTASDLSSRGLVGGHVVLGTIVVDLLAAVGITTPAGAAQFAPLPLPAGVESTWLQIRQRIYFGGGRPHPLAVSSQDLPILWQSDFNSIDDLHSNWVVQEGRWGGDGEQQYSSAHNVTVEDGKLVITVRQETAPDGKPTPYDYTSARVTTYGTESFTGPVRIVSRIKMPSTTGLLPAFWMSGHIPGDAFNWPEEGEIDIAEYYGLGTAASTRTWTGNLIAGTLADNSIPFRLGFLNTDLGTNLSDDYHDYGIDWYSDKIIWHVDGQEVGAITKDQYEALGGNWDAFSGQWKHYLIFTAAVGNSGTGPPDATSEFPQQMLVDWVKVYSLA